MRRKKAVKELKDKYKDKNKITPEQIMAAQADKIVAQRAAQVPEYKMEQQKIDGSPSAKIAPNWLRLLNHQTKTTGISVASQVWQWNYHRMSASQTKKQRSRSS